tara:strand:+ start:254 stop:418 length:165 start_codon:yes stop_codon:yes gene_type:complete
MQVGDLVQNSFNQQLGVILGEAEVNGQFTVWQVLVNGKVTKWQKFQMSVINASR